ncbi:MAG: DUF6624 domain-containing protein [Bacteroidota bacterium]
MKFQTIADKIIALKNADLELRDRLIQNGQLGEGYNEEMNALHDQNAMTLDEIIDQIGYPTIDKVGTAASEAAWMIIQHAIGQPEFMRKCAQQLEQAVLQNEAQPIHLAYLTDRIAVFEGKPQLYGTQFDWDKNGVLNPQPYDDLHKVNQRRKAVDLNTLEEQTEIIRKRTQNENQSPPADFEKRKKQYNEWRKSVGWIK